MNGRAIPGAYIFRLYVCDKEMSWPHHTEETHQPDWVVYVRDSEKFRLTNVIPERIIFVSRGITVYVESSALLGCYATYVVLWHCCPAYWINPQGYKQTEQPIVPTLRGQAVQDYMAPTGRLPTDDERLTYTVHISQKRWPPLHRSGGLASRESNALQSSRKMADSLAQV